MAQALYIKDALGVNVNSSTLDFTTNGTNVTVSSEDQYTYYATATVSATDGQIPSLDGYSTGISSGESAVWAFTLSQYTNPNPQWAGSYAFRSEWSYQDSSNTNVYAFFTLDSSDIAVNGTGEKTINNQVIGNLTFSDIKIFRVLKEDLAAKLANSTFSEAWLQDNAAWVGENVLDVTSGYIDTIESLTLAESLALNTTKLSAQQTFESVTTTVTAALAGDTVNAISLTSQNYDVVVNNEEEVVQYEGSLLNEIITLKAGTVKDAEDAPLEGDKYVSMADSKTYTVKTFALGNGGDDTIYGTSSNDWINGGAGADTIYGGSAGHDALYGGDGDDTIVAGEIVENTSDIVIAEKNIKLNTEGSEIFGGAGDDTIYSGKGDDYIWGGAGDDTINLNGGSNRLVYTNTSFDSTGFGSDTINNFKTNDTLEFYVKNSSQYLGYKLSDLTITGSFPAQGASDAYSDLTIDAGSGNTITVKNFYLTQQNGTQVENLINLNVISENSANEVTTVQYSTDGKIYVDDVSSYYGAANYSEIVSLKKADKALESYKSSADNKTYQIFSLADFSGNTLDDFAQGTSSNDKISGGAGDDILLGGSSGHDVIEGGAGSDYIIAGAKTNSASDFNIAALDNGSDKFYAKFNSTGSELYGGAGDDFIYSSKGNDFIAGNEGDDNIYLQGGSNTLYFLEKGSTAGTSFGSDTVYSATNKDTLQFFKVLNLAPKGYSFDELTFTKSGDDLIIDNSNVSGTVDSASATVKNFFKESNVDKLIAANSQDVETTYSILKDATINVTLDASATIYEGSNYNESITMGTSNVNFIMGSGKNIIKYNASAMGNSTINLTKGENLNLQFTGDISGMTYATNSEDDLILSINGKLITIKSYLSGKTEANVQINGQNMYGWGALAAGLSDLATNSTYTSAQAIENNGKLKGGDMSEYFNVADYTSQTNKGVTITSGGGDDTVIGSNYNDSITLKSGNNTISQSEGTNKIKTGAGNDTFSALSGTSSNTANLGAGNNDVTLQNIGTNKITTGAGNDEFDIDNGANTINAGAGNNIFDIDGGVNKITSSKGNDYFALDAGENTIKSGSGSDTFDISAGVNKITTSNKKTESATFDIDNGINTIKSGSGADIFAIDGGNNNINSGAGNDEFTISTTSTNNIKSGSGDDLFSISAGVNIIDTGSGIDTVNITGISTNNIKLGAGADIITVSNAASTNTIDAGAGNDTINLAIGTNTVNAGSGNDIINITGGTNTVSGGSGNDIFNIDGGTNIIYGGAGKDTYDLIDFTFASDLVISDTSGVSTLKLASIANLDGNAASDGITYSFFANVTKDSTVKAGYRVSGYNLTYDTVADGAITGVSTNKASLDLGKNKKLEITTEGKSSATLSINELAASVASWLSDASHSYASTDALLSSGDTANINSFLATYAINNVYDTAGV